MVRRWPARGLVVTCFNGNHDDLFALLSAGSGLCRAVSAHLAKVGVAGSNPVVRSRETAGQGRCEPALLHVRAVQAVRVPSESRLVHDFVTERALDGPLRRPGRHRSK
jgi:hypothetical protein